MGLDLVPKSDILNNTDVNHKYEILGVFLGRGWGLVNFGLPDLLLIFWSQYSDWVHSGQVPVSENLLLVCGLTL